MAAPWEKYGTQPSQAPQPPAAKPWEKYAQAPPPQSESADGLDGVRNSLPVRFGSNVVKGAAMLPGLPLEAMVMGGNFLRRQMGAPEVNLENTFAKDWGARGFLDFAERNLGKSTLRAPSNELERITDKAGQFVGGSLPFGPAGVIPSLTATAGSEVGRATDRAGLTGGYGETVGAIVGGAGPGLVRGQTTAGLRGDAPTNAGLRAFAKEKYTAAEQAGVIFNQNGVNRIAQGIRTDLTQLRFRPKFQTDVAKVLDELDSTLTGGNTTLEGLESLRGVTANAIRDSIKPLEKEMLGKIVERIDDFIDNPHPAELVAGNAPAAAAALREARSAWKRMRKSEIVDEALSTGELNASTAGSGGNVDNAIRQRVKAILRNKKTRNQFTREEQRAMMQVAGGTVSHNILRGFGGLSPDKGMIPLAMATALGGGIATGGISPIYAAVIPAAMAARRGAEALTRRNVQRLSEIVRRGPQQAAPGNQAQRIADEIARRAKLGAKSALRGTTGAITYQGQQK